MTWRHDTTISCAVSVAVESSISSAEMNAFLSRYKECTYEYVGIDDVGLEFTEMDAFLSRYQECTYEDVGIDNVGIDARWLANVGPSL